MAVIRCNKCGYIREVKDDYVGRLVKCPDCKNSITVYNTVTFIKALLKKYTLQAQELQKLRKDTTTAQPKKKKAKNSSINNININCTDVFTKETSYIPIVNWFKKRNIKTEIHPEAVDTTGFFDEIALLIGNNFKILEFVIKQIKYIQNKGYSNVKIVLSNKSQKEIQEITSFCQTLYDYSFVAKYFYHKKDKIIRLTLQTAPRIRGFFNGGWMEWFALMKLLKLFKIEKITPAIARNLEITFPNGDIHELDIFFLTEDNIPMYIECKSGEFRQDISKYLSLKRELKIDKEQFIICVFGLTKAHAQGMTSMYDLTFVNEATLIEHVKNVI